MISRVVSAHFANQTIWNDIEMLAETRSYILRWQWFLLWSTSPIPMKSGNILCILKVWLHYPLVFLSIYTLFSEGFIRWVHLVDSGWLLNEAETNCEKKKNSLCIVLINSYNPNSLFFVHFFFFWTIFLDTVFHLLTETPWRKLNLAPVCFGAKDNRFGRFQVDVRGSIQAVKLVHLSEQVCCTHYQISWSNWGCDRPQQVQYISVFLTDASNTILLPVNQTAPYIIPGYNAKSSELVFRGFPTPLHLFPGQELRLWYWEDLRDLSEYDNNGTSCTDVFAKYL